ncbi:MAG TPA: hypothetical protein VEW66_04730 [Thermomicrobiales bacterium]|nr:hypothetical protein [Thermomicrobiales bacterium]
MTERRRTLTGLMIVTVLLAAVLISRAGAQGSLATPDAGTASHPAHIHSGTCASSGEVEFPLEPVTAAGAMVSPEASPTLELTSTPAMSSVTLTSTTIVDTTLEDLLSHDHAINVHESDDNIQTSIACGETTGTPHDGMLTIELAELNGSGVTGQVILTGNDDFTTTVTIHVTQNIMATPTG